MRVWRGGGVCYLVIVAPAIFHVGLIACFRCLYGRVRESEQRFGVWHGLCQDAPLVDAAQHGQISEHVHHVGVSSEDPRVSLQSPEEIAQDERSRRPHGVLSVVRGIAVPAVDAKCPS